MRLAADAGPASQYRRCRRQRARGVEEPSRFPARPARRRRRPFLVFWPRRGFRVYCESSSQSLDSRGVLHKLSLTRLIIYRGPRQPLVCASGIQAREEVPGCFLKCHLVEGRARTSAIQQALVRGARALGSRAGLALASHRACRRPRRPPPPSRRLPPSHLPVVLSRRPCPRIRGLVSRPPASIAVLARGGGETSAAACAASRATALASQRRLRAGARLYKPFFCQAKSRASGM